jgi:hypothetical protein
MNFGFENTKRKWHWIELESCNLREITLTSLFIIENVKVLTAIFWLLIGHIKKNGCCKKGFTFRTPFVRKTETLYWGFLLFMCFGLVILPVGQSIGKLHKLFVSILSIRFYRSADKSLARLTSRCILFDGENISFDASLVIYIISINIPPITGVLISP